MSSKSFGIQKSKRAHLIEGKRGLAGEVADLRNDVESAFHGIEEGGGLYRTDEFTAPAAADAARFLTSTPMINIVQRLTAGDFANISTESGSARAVTITRTSVPGAYTTDPIVVTGTNRGTRVILTFVPASVDGGDTLTATEKNGIDTIVSVDIPAQALTTGAITIGIGADLVLRNPVRTRAGAVNIIREITDGTIAAAVPDGTLDGQIYTPSVAPDGVHNYAVVYEAE